MILLNNPKYRYPYYWASFIPSANWSEMKSEFSWNVEKGIFAVSLGLVVLFASFIGSKRYLFNKRFEKK